MNHRMAFTRKTILLLAAALLVALVVIALVDLRDRGQALAGQDEFFDWRSEWAVEEGYSLQRDSAGFHLPTAIAFVPDPGEGPKDPLYFVTELRGTVKVVTNDRSVLTFAEDFFELTPAKELPAVEGETGLAGICLAPEQGYVFVTFAYMDGEQVLHNNIARFETQPGTFAVEPRGQKLFTELFQPYESAISHQIGSCQVADGHLLVSVGDGRQTEESQEVNSLLGKVLRMTLDGQPAPDNPFYDAQDADRFADYVWAYGFRNPFGLSVVDGQVFVADNGSDLDRFVAVQPGENYLWDGTDWSIGSRADVSFNPDIGPAQMDYYPGGLRDLPDALGGSFFITASRPELAGVVRVSPGAGDLQGGPPSFSVPEFFVRYTGDSHQIVSGVAVGPDGLYFVPVMPGGDGESAVLKVAYRPDQASPYLLANLADPVALMWEKGCFGCHMLDHEGGTAGPPLDRRDMVERLEARLSSLEYQEIAASADSLDREPFNRYREAREEVARASGDEKLRLWMIYHIMEPRFDNPYSQMPNLELTRPQATLITDYLLREPPFQERAIELVMGYFPEGIWPRHLVFAFAGGLLAGMALLALGGLAWRQFARRAGKRGR